MNTKGEINISLIESIKVLKGGYANDHNFKWVFS